ncbi:MAG: flagellar protein FlaG [Chitinispirillia bacterium]|nr:flagellar protein FlaG [Chitinispirillia bacterium]
MRIGDSGCAPIEPVYVGGSGSSSGDGAPAVEVRSEPAANVTIGQQAPAPAPAAVGPGSGKSGGDRDLAELMEQPVKQANASLKVFNRQIERSVHEVTKTVMYVIRDTTNNEVIAEYPPKKIQDMIAKMWELAGLFVDEKV